MSGRKTIEVGALLAKVNHRNRKSTCSADRRAGWNSLLEAVLMETDNYRGYAYLKPDEVPADHAPGILEDRGPYPKGLGTDNDDAFIGCDDTRRHYHVDARIKQDYALAMAEIKELHRG